MGFIGLPSSRPWSCERSRLPSSAGGASESSLERSARSSPGLPQAKGETFRAAAPAPIWYQQRDLGVDEASKGGFPPAVAGRAAPGDAAPSGPLTRARFPLVAGCPLDAAVACAASGVRTSKAAHRGPHRVNRPRRRIPGLATGPNSSRFDASAPAIASSTSAATSPLSQWPLSQIRNPRAGYRRRPVHRPTALPRHGVRPPGPRAADRRSDTARRGAAQPPQAPAEPPPCGSACTPVGTGTPGARRRIPTATTERLA